MFSNESVFELMHPPNRQNERVWEHSSAEGPAIETVKQPLNVIAWAMMSHRGLSDLHRPPRPDRDGRVLRGGCTEEYGNVGDEPEETGGRQHR